MRVSGIYCEGRPIHKRGNGERKGERERETTTVTLDRFNAQSTVGEDHMGLEREIYCSGKGAGMQNYWIVFLSTWQRQNAVKLREEEFVDTDEIAVICFM